MLVSNGVLYSKKNSSRFNDMQLGLIIFKSITAIQCFKSTLQNRIAKRVHYTINCKNGHLQDYLFFLPTYSILTRK